MSQLPEALGVSVALMAIVTLIHYSALALLRKLLPHLGLQRGWSMVIGVFALFLAHLVEIFLFAAAYWGLRRFSAEPIFNESFGETAMQLVHFSATAYTTLGLSDAEPAGIAKIVAPLESLTGFMMITWSATYTYAAMQFWQEEEEE